LIPLWLTGFSLSSSDGRPLLCSPERNGKGDGPLFLVQPSRRVPKDGFFVDLLVKDHNHCAVFFLLFSPCSPGHRVLPVFTQLQSIPRPGGSPFSFCFYQRHFWRRLPLTWRPPFRRVLDSPLVPSRPDLLHFFVSIDELLDAGSFSDTC